MTLVTRMLTLAVVAVGVTLATAQSPSPAAPAPADKAECRAADGRPNLNTPNLAANCPDLFAWTKFIEVNGPAPNAKGKVLWQTWATDPDTFPATPNPTQCKPAEPAAGHLSGLAGRRGPSHDSARREARRRRQRSDDTGAA